MLLCTKRGRCKAPGLRRRRRRRRIVPRTPDVPFAFTAPLGLVHPLARAHVRLLGPCFKTGRRDRRPTRDRDAVRTSPRERGCSLYETARIPAGSGDRRRGLGRRPARADRRTSPRTSFRPSQRYVAPAAGEVQPPSGRWRRGASSRIAVPPPAPDVGLNLRRQLRESLRLPLRSFTYS